MTINLTPAAARALGIDVPAARTRAKTTRKAVPAADCSPTRCHTCRATFPRQADEDRHAAANPTHRRFEAVLEVLP